MQTVAADIGDFDKMNLNFNFDMYLNSRQSKFRRPKSG